MRRELFAEGNNKTRQPSIAELQFQMDEKPIENGREKMLDFQ